MGEKKESFHYVYSSGQQEELRRIRDKYIQGEEDKMEQIRRLDESASKPGKLAGLAVGCLGVLLLGVGLCCTTVWMDTMFIPGIILGVIGIAGISASYPLYSHITKKRREKIAPEILRMTEELME